MAGVVVNTLNSDGFIRGLRLRISEDCRDPQWLVSASRWALVFAFALRLMWGVLVPVVPMSDSLAYDVFAQNIAAGECFCWKPGAPTAHWAVGAAAVYALIYSVFGHSYVPIVILNVIVGVGTVAIAMSLARHWMGPVAAVVTGWLLALWPQLVQFTTILASEMLFNFCVLLAFWLATRSQWRWLARAMYVGVALAAAVYLRPIALLLAPLIYLPEAVSQRKLMKPLVACVVSCIVMFALVLPWSMRNLQVFGHFVLVSANAGANFWMGNNPNTTGAYMPLPKTDIRNEVERDRYFSQQAWEYIRQDPVAFVGRTVKKAFVLHDRESIGVSWNEEGLAQRYGIGIFMPLKILNSLYWWLILGFAAFGLMCTFRQRTLPEFLTFPLVTVWAYYTVVHAIIVSGDRYHVPSSPFIGMLAAVAIAAYLEGKRTTEPKTGTSRA